MPHENIIARIQEKMKKCSKGQRAIGQFIIEQYDKAAFMTAARLAKIVGISESTVVRFASELGYDGYPGFQKALQEIVRLKITGYQRMEIAIDKIGHDDILSNVLHADMDRIKRTSENINIKDFELAVDMILSAKHVYVLGFGSSSLLADFLASYMTMFSDNLKVITTSDTSGIFEQLLKLKPGDVVIGMSFPRYSKRIIQAMHFAKDNAAKVITLTDSQTSPVTKYADISLVACSDMTSFVDSLVAPLSVINALVVAIAMRKKDEVYSTLEKLEKIWDEYEVYEKYE